MLATTPSLQPPLPFVGREPELARLDALLQTMLAGNGQVCCVAGEPGAGKTALVQEFTQRAQERHPELVIAVADCSATSATSDAYLPFREILALLTGDVDASVAEGAITSENATRLLNLVERAGEAVAEYGVDLIDVLIPGTALVTRIGSKLAKRLGFSAKSQPARGGPLALDDPARVLLQFTNVVRNIATTRPLVLLIDDAHWADRASIDLLFHLARRIEGSRLLLLVTYRSNEISAERSGERHPLVPVLNEVRRYYGDTTIDLDSADTAARRAFVDRLIDAEPHELPPSFRDELLRHSQGHPLFTVELLQALRERGILTRNGSGAWRLAGAVDWHVLPKRSEGIIAERLGRVPPELREFLSIGAVEGDQFTAQVVAQVARSDAHTVMRALSDVAERKHQLVRAQGIQKLGGERLATYRFRHELFRAYLYASLDHVQRAEMHFEVGRALEQLRATALEAAAPALADHFEQAGEPESAIRYLDLAATSAMRRHAPRQAGELWQRALTLGDVSAMSVPERLAMLESRGDALRSAGAFDESRAALQLAFDIVGDDQLARARLLRKIGGCLADQHQMRAALAHLEQAQASLPVHADADVAVTAERVQLLLDCAWALYWTNDIAGMAELLAEGNEHIDRYGTADDRARWLQTRALMMLRSQRYRPSDELIELAARQLAAAGASDRGTTYAHCAFLDGFAHLWRGDLVSAERGLQEGLRAAEKHAHGLIVVLAKTYLAVLHRLRGDVGAVMSATASSEAAAREANMLTYVATAQANRAWVHLRRGELEQVEPLTRAALDEWTRSAATYPFQWLAAWPLAAVLQSRAALREAVEVMELALTPAQQLAPPGLAEAVREARGALDHEDGEAAREHVQRALDIARAAGEL